MMLLLLLLVPVPGLAERCLELEPEPERKIFSHNGQIENITLLGSHRVASR